METQRELLALYSECVRFENVPVGHCDVTSWHNNINSAAGETRCCLHLSGKQYVHLSASAVSQSELENACKYSNIKVS